MLRKTLVAAVALAASIGVMAPTASASEADLSAATSCTTYLIPDGVGGYNVSVGGHTVRIPKVEDVRFCAGTTGVSTYTNVFQQHSACGPTCFSVWGPAALSNPTVSTSLCYTQDGVRTCTNRSLAVNASASRPCFLSVGKPAQHTPSQCLVVIDEDNFFALPQ